ncbi:MAG TPA: hypothetical protein VIE88_04280 [Vicinamibacteria bacterium]
MPSVRLARKAILMRQWIPSLGLLFLSATAEPATLYRSMFVQAAPGRLLDLIALYKERLPVYDAAGDERPLMMRHSQGDRWDLMLLFPMGSFTEYYAPERVQKRRAAAEQSSLPPDEFRKRVYECIAWHEEVFVDGPPLPEVKTAWSAAGYYHLEIFVALPGKQAELYREREMENAYSKGIGRPETLIFTHVEGAAWDLFTMDFYPDLKTYAALNDVPAEKREAAARAAGFPSADAIGPTLRTLISIHHDTLGGPVR